jgi:hypothetical protein
VQCGGAPPTFTVYGQITSKTAGQLSYSWIRSNGSQIGPQVVTVSAGQTVNVTDSVTAASDTYSGSDTLQVSSPVSMSRSIPITVTCTASPPPPPPPTSHVSAVTVSNVALNQTLTSCSVPAPQAITGSFSVQVQASSTAKVTLTWQTSQSTSASPGPAIGNGSATLSGQTSYQLSFPIPGGSPVSFGDFPQPGNGCVSTYFFVQVTATGTDGKMMPASNYYLFPIT